MLQTTDNGSFTLSCLVINLVEDAVKKNNK